MVSKFLGRNKIPLDRYTEDALLIAAWSPDLSSAAATGSEEHFSKMLWVFGLQVASFNTGPALPRIEMRIREVYEGS